MHRSDQGVEGAPAVQGASADHSVAVPESSAGAPATLRAVAARAGVSKSVVSRVLQGSPHVSEERRNLVEAAIRELGYRPNSAARSLTQRRTHAIGVLVNDLRQPWTVDFLGGLHIALFEHHLHPFLADGRLDRATDEQLLRVFMEMRVDGLVLAATMPDSTMIEEAATRLPTVVAGGRDFTLPCIDTIAQDDWRGAELALDHLFTLGHRRIGHIAGNRTKVFAIRRASYDAWMADHGLSALGGVALCDTTEEGGFRAAWQLLDVLASVRPTAVLVANDMSCVGAMAAARDLGLDVPGDVSFASFDNSFLARMRGIQLTSVDVAPDQVGRLAARHLVERIADASIASREHLITPTLVVRRSTAPPRDR